VKEEPDEGKLCSAPAGSDQREGRGGRRGSHTDEISVQETSSSSGCVIRRVRTKRGDLKYGQGVEGV
jgi:hypothetical protein